VQSPGSGPDESREPAAADGGKEVQFVQMRGELDLATADTVAARGYAAVGSQAQVLLLDLAGVSFCDARGLSALVRIANRADTAGCRYGLIAPRPQLVKILQITGLDHRLPVFATVDDALADLTRATGSGAQRMAPSHLSAGGTSGASHCGNGWG
jgi:anti-anti-sigma factor